MGVGGGQWLVVSGQLRVGAGRVVNDGRCAWRAPTEGRSDTLS